MDEVLDDYTRKAKARHEWATRRAYLTGVNRRQLSKASSKPNRSSTRQYAVKDEILGIIESTALDPDNGHIQYVALSTSGFSR
ncbi:MAG TPA: hypothetical protein VKB96_14400 [Gammaproteobacteria bacterium]|nr:hypothetical protein [Gammaproteobacteria bacterium]